MRAIDDIRELASQATGYLAALAATWLHGPRHYGAAIEIQQAMVDASTRGRDYWADRWGDVIALQAMQNAASLRRFGVVLGGATKPAGIWPIATTDNPQVNVMALRKVSRR